MIIRSALRPVVPLSPAEPPTPRVAELPAVVGVRVFCLWLLDGAVAAHARLGDSDDADALHDFRVALRRLRSTIRAYDTILEDTVARKLRKRLRRVARRTGASRDLEVHIEWLGALADVPDRIVAAARTLAGELEKRKQESDASVRKEIRADFAPLEADTRAAFARYRGTVDPARPLGDTTAEAAAARVIHLTAELHTHLAAVRAVHDQEEAHQSRIATKRLRYVIEPFMGSFPAADALVGSLKSLQKDLGDLHDLHTLLAELDSAPKSGTNAASSAVDSARMDLREEVHRQRDRLYARIQERWLDGQAAPLLAAARDVAAELQSLSAPSVEIERKFVLRRMPRLRGLDAKMQRIEQGYLPGAAIVERVRFVREDSEKRYHRTIKTGQGVVRGEVEEEIEESFYRRVWPLTKGRRIRKRRYAVQDGPFTWEIDRFDHIGLVLAEIELPAPDTPVVPPAWLAHLIEREVTDDPDFINLNLAG